MNIYLDDEPVALDDAATMTIEQMADALRERLQDSGRLLTTIRCDGRTVRETELESVLAADAGRFESIEFQSSDTRELVRSALAEAAELFDDTDRGRLDAADLLNEGRHTEAMQTLGECFRAWGRAHESLVKTHQILQLGLAEVRFDESSLIASLDRLVGKLRDLKAALEATDYVLVADILRYEFDEIAEQWRRLIASLIKGIGGEAA